MLPQFDKYAPYIWWAYGIAGTILIGLIAWSILRTMAARKKLDALEDLDPLEDKEPPK